MNGNLVGFFFFLFSIHVYSHGAGADNHFGTNSFHKQISQGHDLNKFCSASMPDHAKFQNYRPSGLEKILKVFAINSHGGHLGHVTLTI